MTCPRCTGLMLPTFLESSDDILFRLPAYGCANCGFYHEPQMAYNRTLPPIPDQVGQGCIGGKVINCKSHRGEKMSEPDDYK